MDTKMIEFDRISKALSLSLQHAAASGFDDKGLDGLKQAEQDLRNALSYHLQKSSR